MYVGPWQEYKLHQNRVAVSKLPPTTSSNSALNGISSLSQSHQSSGVSSKQLIEIKNALLQKLDSDAVEAALQAMEPLLMNVINSNNHNNHKLPSLSTTDSLNSKGKTNKNSSKNKVPSLVVQDWNAPLSRETLEGLQQGMQFKRRLKPFVLKDTDEAGRIRGGKFISIKVL